MAVSLGAALVLGDLALLLGKASPFQRGQRAIAITLLDALGLAG